MSSLIILTFLTIILCGCVCLISITVFSLIIVHLFTNRTKQEERITLILTANIFIFIFIYGLIIVLVCINTVLGEFYGYNFESSWCIFSGYLITVIIAALFDSFVVQSFFRLCRIVYSSYTWLQLYWYYIIAGPIQLIIASVLLCPVLVWHDVCYLPTEYLCFIPFLHIRGILWAIANAYVVPLLAVSLIYVRVMIFIHNHSNNQTIKVRRRQEKNLLAMRRIMITVGMLLVIGIPSLVLLLMTMISGIEHSLNYRIQWITSGITMTGLSIITSIFNPEVKRILLRRWRSNRVGCIVGNIENPIQLKTAVQQTD